MDGDSGEVKILDYISVNDAGPRINPTVVDGQIQGGIAQGLGGAMMEEIYYDEGAQPLGTFLDYAIPRATDMPDVRQDHLETPSPLNPLGVKGLGEGGTLAPPAVLAASGGPPRPKVQARPPLPPPARPAAPACRPPPVP